jgi:ankyrin
MELLDRQGGKTNHGGGMIPSHIAAYAGAASTLRVILEKSQARVDQPSRENMTALHYCSRSGDHVDAARVLIEHGADANVKGHERMTPLHCAAAAGRRALAEYLTDNGADVTALTMKGMTSAQLAMAGGHKELHAFLSTRDKRGAITRMRDALRN